MLGRPPNRREQLRLHEIQDRGCVPCWLESKLQGREWFVEPCDIHHVIQNDWSQTYGNCPWHHRGVCKNGLTTTIMNGVFGPSMAYDPLRYRSRYGTEAEMLVFQSRLLLKSADEYMREI